MMLELTAAVASGALFWAGRRVAACGMQPTSQLFGAAVVSAPDPDPLHHTVALTYDDGPNARNTPALLDLLARHGVHATFFLIGEHVRRHPELARRIVEAGHTVGNHTATHPNLARLTPARARREIERCQQTMEDTLGLTPRLFRPPFGARRPDTLRSACSLGLCTVLWNVTTHDWEPIGADRMLRHVDAALTTNRRGHRSSTVLLHDASHLDGFHPISREDSITVTAALLARPRLRFCALTDLGTPRNDS